MILIACDKFKGTLSAGSANQIIAEALGVLGVADEIISLPMADGGEGTAEALGASPVEYSRNVFRLPESDETLLLSCDFAGWKCHETASRPITDRSTYALGRAIRDTMDSPGRSRRIYVGIGGTATADGGAGLLQGLGFKFVDYSGKVITEPITPCILLDCASKVISPGEHMIEETRRHIVALSDVEASLTGPGLSALDFLKQKGAANADVRLIKRALSHLHRITGSKTSNIDGAGGGIGFALASVIGSEALSGAQFVIDRRIAPLDNIRLIITGEGCIDSQTTGGKAVDALNRFGKVHGIPVLSLGGCVIGNPPYKHVKATCPYSPGGSTPTADVAAANLREAVLDLSGFFRTFVK